MWSRVLHGCVLFFPSWGVAFCLAAGHCLLPGSNESRCKKGSPSRLPNCGNGLIVWRFHALDPSGLQGAMDFVIMSNLRL